MGLLDRLRRKKKSKLDEARFPTISTYTPPARAAPTPMPAPMPTPTASVAMPELPPLPRAPAVATSATSGSLKAGLDLVLSQMENLRMQYEAISSRLQNIERLVSEIRSFCK